MKEKLLRTIRAINQEPSEKRVSHSGNDFDVLIPLNLYFFGTSLIHSLIKSRGELARCKVLHEARAYTGEQKRHVVSPCPSSETGLKLISTRVHRGPHACTQSVIFRKCWYLRVRMRELTLHRGTRGQIKKTSSSCRVSPENGGLRTWVTETINLTVPFRIL